MQRPCDQIGNQGASEGLELKEINNFVYKRPEIAKGYASQYLDIDLSRSLVVIAPIPEEVKETFIGGKGLVLWLLWNAVSGTTKWNDAENYPEAVYTALHAAAELNPLWNHKADCALPSAT